MQKSPNHQKPQKTLPPPLKKSSPDTPKLQKVLAETGRFSRRQAEEWISQGRVTVNGAVAQIGQRIKSTDTICIDGKSIARADLLVTPSLVLLYHKPVGEICSREGQGFPTVFEHLPPLEQGRWISIGRLDLNSSGLLLFTNDGTLANQWMHPRSGWLRRYQVRIDGEVTPEITKRLLDGIPDKGEILKLAEIRCRPLKTTRNQWVEVSLAEGKNREIRRLFEAVGLKVNRLIRTHYGPYVLPENLRPGEYQLTHAPGKDFHD